MLTDSTYLQQWWAELDGMWKHVLVSELGLKGMFDPETDLSYLETITELDCSGTNLYHLEPITKLPNLRFLDISETNVSSLTPLRHLDHLEEFHASFCQFSSIRDLLHLTKLRVLDVSYPYNSIGDLSLLACIPSLQELYLNACMMGEMNFLQNLHKLSTLSIHFNPLDPQEVANFQDGNDACQVLF
jgi:Leucine-rich repeat (LRR) protein